MQQLLGELYKLGLSDDIDLASQGTTVRIRKFRWFDTVEDMVAFAKTADAIVEHLSADRPSTSQHTSEATV